MVCLIILFSFSVCVCSVNLLTFFVNSLFYKVVTKAMTILGCLTQMKYMCGLHSKIYWYLICTLYCVFSVQFWST